MGVALLTVREVTSPEPLEILLPASSTPETGTAVVPDGTLRGGAPPPQAEGLVNVNTADRAALESLDGIGPVLAQAIIRHREQWSPFQRIEDLLLVPGIGPRTLERLRNRVTVE